LNQNPEEIKLPRFVKWGLITSLDGFIIRLLLLPREPVRGKPELNFSWLEFPIFNFYQVVLRLAGLKARQA
jgi:hypothetical protein